ncbi:MAG TPA: RNA polymerase-binding protein DksA [Thermodesulfovibrionales bacterium]|nr:RNA polymerase-binding protein DksA [Thermodesulfovibrionales bacterium]
MPKKKMTGKSKQPKTKKVMPKKAKTKPAKTKTVKTKIVKTKTKKPKIAKTAKTKIVEPTKTKKAKELTLREKKIQDIRKKLIAQKEALLEEAEEALSKLPGQTVFPDLGDQATAETERSFMLRLRGRERRLLKKIENAIERVEQGTFGICDRCGNEIDIRRLEARPVTTMCIECKIQQEEEEKLMEI